MFRSRDPCHGNNTATYSCHTLFQKESSFNLEYTFFGGICKNTLYEYDFGDLWQHEILLEETHPLNPKKTYPCCIGGARQAPQEDCGGPWDFLALESHYSLPYMAERLWEIIEEGRRDEYWECAVSGLRFLVPSLPQKPELLS